MIKFWYPAAIVPADKLWYVVITPIFSATAKTTPVKQKQDKKHKTDVPKKTSTPNAYIINQV